MRVCKNHHKVDSDAAVCPVCGADIIDLDAARANSQMIQAKYGQTENPSKFGIFMKAVAKVTEKMCDTLEKKAK